MFNDKITKKIAESVKEVLEANNEEVPPVVTGRLPASALQKKKVTRKAIPKGETPLVQTGQGDYTKKTMPSDIPTGPVVNVKDTVSKLANRVKGILKPKRKI